MNNNKRILIIIGIVVVLGSIALIYAVNQARSQGGMPGTFALKNEEDVIAVGLTVATFNSTKSEPSIEPGFKSLQNINLEEFKNLLEATGNSGDTSVLVKSDATTNNKFIWLVTFTGSFMPQHGPDGTKRPIYSIIDIYLDARDGSVIGISMHDE
jgi:hypothetical protein